jgi:cation diffusion facilitator CzcD-associated flavoprotein CzcO
VGKQLPQDYDVGTHFTPRYGPWDQRMCFVPDGNLFGAIASGRASVVTDEIETFTERGLTLVSGEEIEADAIITATGLNMQVFGGMTLCVDGRDVDLAKTVAYKGIMLCGVPNFATTFGYTNASWTLKADLAADYVCRLLNYMDRHGERQCVPRRPDSSLPTEPFLNLKSGYVLRSADQLPKQGAKTPWRLHQNYPLDVLMLRFGRVEEEMDFARA